MYGYRKVFYCALFALLLWTTPAECRTVIRGIVRDATNDEGLPFASLRVDNDKSTSLADARGLFEMTVPQGATELHVSCQGYATKTVRLGQTSLNLYDISLMPESKELKEVVVHRKKYSKKNNPAVDFVKKIKERASASDPRNCDFYSYDSYRRVTLGISDFDTSMTNTVVRKLPFLIEHVDTSEINGEPVLTVSVKEKASSHFSRRNPKSEKTIVRGVSSQGIDEILTQENVQTMLDEILREVNLYDKDITLFNNTFVSPLSPFAPDFYRFYLVDSTAVLEKGGPKHMVLAFYPRNKSSLGFKGHLYVEAGDTSMLVRRVEMDVADEINLNYIKNLKLSQDFGRTADGLRLKQNDILFADMQVMPNTPRIYLSRKLVYDNHSFERPTDADSIFALTGTVINEEGSDSRDSIFWVEKRNLRMQKGERNIGSLMESLRQKPVFYYGEKILRILVHGYIRTGKDSKFDYGPVNTTASYNALEGLRLRAGGTTTANLNPHLFGRGYIAYGFRDRKWKYEAEAEYSFPKKKYHPNEFPIHSIKVRHRYDVDHLGAHYLYTNSDNFVLSLSRLPDRSFTYQRLTSALYTLELNNHFSFKVGVEILREEASPYVSFTNGYGSHFNHYNERVMTVDIRYAPGEKFYQSRSERIPLNREAPVIELSHRWAPKGFAGSTYGINRTELALSKDFSLSFLGRLKARLSGGHNWSAAPFPELFIPNANLSYTIQPESFALMNPMEFINSSYGAMHLSWHLRGALFNLIPGFRRLSLREIVSFSCMYGHLNDKCNPAYNKELLVFPQEKQFQQMNQPYMEISAGIDNIFTILRLDYVWRLNYLDVPYKIDRSGLRVALHFTF